MVGGELEWCYCSCSTTWQIAVFVETWEILSSKLVRGESAHSWEIPHVSEFWVKDKHTQHVFVFTLALNFFKPFLNLIVSSHACSQIFSCDYISFSKMLYFQKVRNPDFFFCPFLVKICPLSLYRLLLQIAGDIHSLTPLQGYKLNAALYSTLSKQCCKCVFAKWHENVIYYTRCPLA